MPTIVNQSVTDNSSIIPTTAVEIKIKTIQNPYLIRGYESKDYSDKLDLIQRKILTWMRNENNLTCSEELQIGDMVIVESSKCKSEMELPSFVCRGLITNIKSKNEVYYVLLVDHGTTIELTRDQFCVVPHNFIPEEYLTKVFGIYNILPIRTKKNVSNDDLDKPNDSSSTAFVVLEWSEEAIQFAKDLLYDSKVIYFDHLATDKTNGREYGEFYLAFDNMDISLSEALIINYCAVSMNNGFLQLLNENHAQSKENMKDHIINVKFSHNRTNRNNAIQVARRAQVNYSLKEFCLSEKVLIQSTMHCGVLSDVRDLRYPKGIHQGWNKRIDSSRPRKLQSYIWPAINNGLNVVAIGSLQCGKTTGCAMAVCGLVALRQSEISYSATHPLALILCPSSFEAMNVHSLCRSFLQPFDNIKCVAAFNGMNYVSVATSIYNGCQVLVATPRYLARFLNENKNLLSFDRLSCLVLDNADVILDKYYDSLGDLFKKHKIIENRESQSDDRPILQMIFSATMWTPQLKKFVFVTMYNPYICITSFIEAVAFKSVKPNMFISKSTDKNNKLLGVMGDDYTTLKTMIICINAEEAEELNTFLLSKNKETLLIHEKMQSSNIRVLQETWKACVRSLYPILICTDAVLSDLNITDIQWLIHYSVQMKLKNQFNYRFSVLLDNLTQDIPNCKVSILIDERNNLQYVSLIKMLQRMKVSIPPAQLICSNKIAITLEMDKKDYAICDYVKSYGFCHEKDVCVFRHHILPGIDAPMTNIQINDKVILMVTYLHDTTHFSARIIEYTSQSSGSKKIKFSDAEYMEIALKIQQYYKNVENRKVCMSTNVGDICGYEEAIDTFKRVQIMRIRHDKDSSEEVKFVDVRCIDTGTIIESINVCKLMYIPEELSSLPTHTVEVFLAGLTPHDEEYSWNHFTNEVIHKWFSKNFDERSYITGKVRLHLGNTIWLDDLQVGTKLLGFSDMIGSSLKDELIKKKVAILNDKHMKDLFELCKNSGLKEINGHDINTMMHK